MTTNTGEATTTPEKELPVSDVEMNPILKWEVDAKTKKENAKGPNRKANNGDMSMEDLTPEQIEQAKAYIEKQRAEAVLWVPMRQIESYIDKDLGITEEEKQTYRQKWIEKYLESLVQICIILPALVKVNQEILVAHEEVIAQQKPDTELRHQAKANRLETINHIMTLKQQMNDKTDHLVQHAEIISQLKAI